MGEGSKANPFKTGHWQNVKRVSWKKRNGYLLITIDWTDSGTAIPARPDIQLLLDKSQKVIDEAPEIYSSNFIPASTQTTTHYFVWLSDLGAEPTAETYASPVPNEIVCYGDLGAKRAADVLWVWYTQIPYAGYPSSMAVWAVGNIPSGEAACTTFASLYNSAPSVSNHAYVGSFTVSTPIPAYGEAALSQTFLVSTPLKQTDCQAFIGAKTSSVVVQSYSGQKITSIQQITGPEAGGYGHVDLIPYDAIATARNTVEATTYGITSESVPFDGGGNMNKSPYLWVDVTGGANGPAT